MKILLLIFVLVFSALGQKLPLPTDEAIKAAIEKERIYGVKKSEDESLPLEQQVKIREVLEDANLYFKRGLFSIQDNRRAQAGENFDKSVETFLKSSVNVLLSEKIYACYSQAIETIYRIEFPSNLQPQIKSLSATCGWNLDPKLADDVVTKLNQQATPNITKTKTNTVIVSFGNNADGLKQGFNEQEFVPSPFDELAKLDLTDEEKDVISTPKVIQKAQFANLKLVKAQKGDTVTKIAQRYNASPIDVAKFNGLLPNTPLLQGREVTIPFYRGISVAQLQIANGSSKDILLGIKPTQSKDGKVSLVMKYFDENFNDPYSMKFVKWSPVEKTYLSDEPFWGVRVRFRAKNGYNAYILSEMIFYIQRGKIITVKKVF